MTTSPSVLTEHWTGWATLYLGAIKTGWSNRIVGRSVLGHLVVLHLCRLGSRACRWPARPGLISREVSV